MDEVEIVVKDKDGDFLEVESRKPGRCLSPCAFLRTSEGGFWVGDGNTEDEVFSALLSAVRRYKPDYCPPGFVPIGGADQARTDMQQVSDCDSPLRGDGKLAEQSGPALKYGTRNDLVEGDRDHRQFCEDVDSVLFNLYEVLREKNLSYGNSLLDPVCCFSKLSPEERIRDRIDDKISRIQRGNDFGEDTLLDLIGYLVMLRISQMKDMPF